MLDKHAGFIAASYGVFFGLIAILIFVTLLRSKATKQRLSELQDQWERSKSIGAQNEDE